MVSLNASVGRRGRGRSLRGGAIDPVPPTAVGGRSLRGGAGDPALFSPTEVGGSRRGRGRSLRGGLGNPAPLSPATTFGGSRRRQRKQRKHTRRVQGVDKRHT